MIFLVPYFWGSAKRKQMKEAMISSGTTCKNTSGSIRWFSDPHCPFLCFPEFKQLFQNIIPTLSISKAIIPFFFIEIPRLQIKILWLWPQVVARRSRPLILRAFSPADFFETDNIWCLSDSLGDNFWDIDELGLRGEMFFVLVHEELVGVVIFHFVLSFGKQLVVIWFWVFESDRRWRFPERFVLIHWILQMTSFGGRVLFSFGRR